MNGWEALTYLGLFTWLIVLTLATVWFMDRAERRDAGETRVDSSDGLWHYTVKSQPKPPGHEDESKEVF